MTSPTRTSPLFSNRGGIDRPDVNPNNEITGYDVSQFLSSTIPTYHNSSTFANMKRHFCIGTDYYVVSSRVWPCKRSSKVKWSLTKRILLDSWETRIIQRSFQVLQNTLKEVTHNYKHFTAHVQRWPGWNQDTAYAALNKKKKYCSKAARRCPSNPISRHFQMPAPH